MALIEFKDLPNTTTPINAQNLNNNFNEVSSGIDSKISEILNQVCPIGKIEVFFDNNDHSKHLGFTWERTLVGRTPVGINSSDTDFNTIGKTGGSKELQSHIHGLYTVSSYGYKYALTSKNGTGSIKAGAYPSGAVTETTDLQQVASDSAGTGNAGNLQPYQVVAYWRRIA